VPLTFLIKILFVREATYFPCDIYSLFEMTLHNGIRMWDAGSMFDVSRCTTPIHSDALYFFYIRLPALHHWYMYLHVHVGTSSTLEYIPTCTLYT